MYTISQRLKEIAGLVTVGSRVADIGADHGYLSIYLVKEDIASYVYTCDIGEGPLNNARRNIEKSGVKNIELRLCDGLDGIDPESVDTVIIAGMGGDVISGIIERAPWIKAKNYTLILQPMTSADTLRHYLIENNFGVQKEISISENGKVYTAFAAVYTGQKQNLSPAFYHIGLLKYQSETDKAYIDKQLRILKKCQSDIENVPQKENLFREITATINEIEKIIG